MPLDGEIKTTRVHQYGAVPIGPFPEAGVDELWRGNRLWNTLVEIDRASRKKYDEARREANSDYREIAGKLDAIENEIKEAYSRKRTARMKAGTRDASHPLIANANKEIRKLKADRRKLWEEMKPHRKEADKRVDQKAISDDFKEQVKKAQRRENSGLGGAMANEIARYFKVARGRTFDNPGSRLRFHRFDGTGFLFYRFRRKGNNGEKVTTDGVTFEALTRGDINIGESFSLTSVEPRGSVPVMRLRAKVGGGAKRATKVYAEFDLHLHRPIPKEAQINNAKLLRRRIGDKFTYTVSFSVRVPVAVPPEEPPLRAVGVDIGFKMRDGALRVATIAVEDEIGWKFEHLMLPYEYWLKRMNRVEEIQSKMDDAAKELGVFIKPRLKAHEASSDENHSLYPLVRKITNVPANVTLNYETAYKLGGKIRGAPGNLPPEVEEKVRNWRERWRKSYREMHGLRRKTLAWRREMYRVMAAKLVARGLPIGVENIDLTKFAEVRDADNELSDKARSQRFDVAPSEFLGSVRNCAEREGVPVVKVEPAYTSRTCAECGCLNEVGGEVRWKCSDCGAEHDRDENAAKNIARGVTEKMQK